MDMLNHHSGQSSPTQVNRESKTPTLDKANEEFKEVLEKLQKSSLEMKAANEGEVKTKSVKKTL